MPTHVDEYLDSPTANPIAKRFLEHARSPAHGLRNPKPHPTLFADHNGVRVRVVMASRMGDVGITSQLDKDIGYEGRVFIDELSNFGETP